MTLNRRSHLVKHLWLLLSYFTCLSYASTATSRHCHFLLASGKGLRSRRRGQHWKQQTSSPTLNAMYYHNGNNVLLASSSGRAVTQQQPPDVSYSDLSPVGYLVAGTVEIAFSTLFEFMSGFMGGYALGAVTDVPRLFFRKVEGVENLPFFKECVMRFGRMHGKSFRWAKSWGGISAAFGCCRVATRVARGGKEDGWNQVFSSAAAGAYFARKDGPKGMLRGAVLYGGLMYLLSTDLRGRKSPFEWEDQPVDF